MASRSWDNQFRCKWTREGQLDITGFPEDTPVCLKFYLTSVRPEQWPRALKSIQEGEGHCFISGTGISFPFDYESSSSEEDQPSRGPLPEDEVELFAGQFPKNRLKKSLFLNTIEKCLAERNKLFRHLDGEDEFLDYVRRETKSKRAVDHDLPGPGSTGINRTTSVDSLESPKISLKQTSIVHPSLDTLDLATGIPQEDTNFTDWVINLSIKQLLRSCRRLRQELDTCAGRLKLLEKEHEISKHQLELQEVMVQSLQKQVTSLTEKGDKAQKVLLEEKNKSKELTEANESMERLINDLLDQKTKLTNKLAMKESKEPSKRALAEALGDTESSTQVKSAKDITTEQLTTPSSETDMDKRGQQFQSHHLSLDLPGTCSSDVMADRGGQQSMSASAAYIASQIPHGAAPYHRTYEEYLSTGDRALTDGNLDLAEQEFVSALKLIHDTLKPDPRREADCLCRLGDVYLHTGKRTKEGRKFTQAAALYNAAMARTTQNRPKVMKRLQDVEKSFLFHIANVDSEPSPSDSAIRHQKRLEDMRSSAKSQLEAIDQQHNPYQYDEDDPKMLPVEAERAEAVKALCKSIAKDRQMFIQALINECISTIGPPPCKYAFIGLGSQATELVTPYSDLEFAILIEEGKDNDDTRRYFLNLTHYLNLKVINLGETILPAMAIPSLNDFQSEVPEKDWFFDSVTPHGFAFDGFMPWASKTPFGREQTKSKPPVSLIQTPAEMTKFQQTDISLAEGYHLSDILRRFVFLAGDEELVNEYMETMKTLIKDDLLSHVQARRLSSFTMQPLLENMGKTGAFEPGGQMLDISKKDIEKMGNMPVFELPTGELLNVKKDIYRFPGIAIDLLALFCGIALSASTWDVIDEMKEAGWIHEEDAKHLTVLTSISAELRLRTYMANGGQKDSLSPLAKIDNTDLKSAFHIPDTKVLFRYYCRAKPLRMCMPDMILGRGQPRRVLETAIFDASNECMGRIAGSLFLLDKSILYLEAAVTDAGSDLEKRSQLLNDLGLSYKERGDLQKAIICHQQSLTIKRTILGGYNHPDTVKSLHNLGLALSKLGDYKTAISYLEQALDMKKTVSGDYVADDETAACLNSLGHCWRKLGDHKKAISFYEQFLKMTQSLVGNDKPHRDIAGALNNLAMCWFELGNHNEAIKYWEKSLAMMTTVYGDNTAHPDIAMLLTNLGSAWRALGDPKKAISYLERSLKMLKSIHGEAHADIARTLLNLGTSWLSHGNHEKAVEYCEQSLTMRKGIYRHNTPHPEIAISLHNLGACWATIGDHKKAILYFEEALTMRKAIFGDNSTHPDITALLNNLAMSWSKLGDEKEANSYWVQLQTMKAREAAP